VRKLIDIKDNSPNDKLISQLETILSRAKKGEIRSAVTVCDWSDGDMTHAWAIDERTSRRSLLAELTMLHHDFVVNLSFAEGDTVLSRALEDRD